MKLLSIVKMAGAASIVVIGTAGLSSEPSEAAKVCVVSLVKYIANGCPPGVKYAAMPHHVAVAAGPAARVHVIPTAAKPACVKSLVKFLANRCPA